MKKLALVGALLLTALTHAQDGARYLVITADALESAVQPLAAWKQAAGMQCRVMKLSQVGYDTTAIRDYIRNAWNTWNPRPENVLLVGSPSSLPSRYYRIQGGYSYYSDNIYGDMNGDLRMELPVGRLPAKTAAQCEVMVAKTLAYEQTPEMSDTLWMRRLTTIVREDYDAADDTIYWNNVRHAAALAGAAGFVGCDSFSRARGDDRSDVVNSVNAGTGIVLYRGSAVGNWYTPFDVDPGLTANGRMLPVICSFTCATMTLAPGESMVGEAWVKAGSVASPRGGVAFIGNTHSSSNVAQVRGAVARGFFDGLFTEGLYRAGEATIRGKEQLYIEYPAYVSDYRGFNLLGDPDLGIWTAAPRRLDVQHPYQLRPEPARVEVVVSANGDAVANALVCLSFEPSVYVRGYTDVEGRAVFDISPADTGWMRLVVTGRNLYPYDARVHVTDQVGIADGGVPNPAGRLQVRAWPNSFRSSAELRFSRPLGPGGRVLVNDPAGRLVATLTAAGLDRATWSGADDRGRQAPAGVYFFTVVDGTDRARARLTRLD